MRKMNQQPVIFVEDDLDDQEIYAEAIEQIGIENPVLFFKTGPEAFNYLQTTDDYPFLIISDINMPAMNGIELKQKIQSDFTLRSKHIPFIFISTNASRQSISCANELNVQGFFQKPDKMEDIRKMLKILFDYWLLCSKSEE